MRTCKSCNAEIIQLANGKPKYLKNRQFCYACRPSRHATATRKAELIECTLCKTSKPTTEFYALSSKCKVCDNKNKTERDRALKCKAIAYKGGKCEQCGYNGHYAAFVFHHLRDKEMTWNKMRNSGWEKVKAEIDKCQLLCANCHHIEHSRQHHSEQT